MPWIAVCMPCVILVTVLFQKCVYFYACLANCLPIFVGFVQFFVVHTLLELVCVHVKVLSLCVLFK